MNSKVRTLNNISIFSSLDEAKIGEIDALSIPRSYKKNEVIFHQGDEGTALFVLVSGSVKVSIVDDKGKEMILKILFGNDFFGEISLLDGQCRDTKITSLENSKALLIHRKYFINLMRECPGISLDMLTEMSQRLRNTNNRVASLRFFDAYGKTADALLNMLSDKVKEESGHIIIDSPLTRQEMADMAGLSRESFTRMLREFQTRGCLRVERKRIIILDEAVLKRECGQLY